MFAGAELSTEIRDIYVKCEDSHGKLIRRLSKVTIYVLVTMYLPTLLTPISYYLFGFPLPAEWKQAFLVR